LPMMALLNNYDGVSWQTGEMVKMLASADARQNLVRGVLEFAKESHEAGIVVDLEDIPDTHQANFRQFAARHTDEELRGLLAGELVDAVARDSATERPPHGVDG